MVLLPIMASPFQARLVGPYTVIHHMSDLNYFIETPGQKKKTKVCHVNLLLKPCYVKTEVDH